MRRGPLADMLQPWAGLGVGILTAGLVHQIGSEGVFNSCKPVSPVPLIIVAVLGIVVTTAAGIASSQVLRGKEETAARKVVAVISAGSAALLVFSMILPVIASLILPPCFQ